MLVHQTRGSTVIWNNAGAQLPSTWTPRDLTEIMVVILIETAVT